MLDTIFAVKSIFTFMGDIVFRIIKNVIGFLFLI